MGIRRHDRRADLFLVRVAPSRAGDDNGPVEGQGTVQRVTDGEAHQFSSWQDLVHWLLIMLLDKEGR